MMMKAKNTNPIGNPIFREQGRSSGRMKRRGYLNEDQWTHLTEYGFDIRKYWAYLNRSGE